MTEQLFVDSLDRWPLWASSRSQSPALLCEPPLCSGGPAAPPLDQLSWGDLTVQVERLACQLQRQGFSPGDRLVHRCGNSRRGVLLALASWAVGTIEVPIDPLLEPTAGQALAASVGGRWLDLPAAFADEPVGDNGVAAPHHATAASAALLQRHARRDREEASLILFTSGTGGKAKAVTLSRHNLASNAAAKLQAVPQSVQDVRLCLLPICHAYARTCDLATWLLSGCVLAITSGWDGWKRLAPSVRPTMLNSVPSVATRLLAEPQQAVELSRLRTLGCGGAALPAEAFAAFASRGITVIQGYGMTETSPVICSASPDNARPGWVGPPVRGWHTRVEADGRLWVRGDGVMLGYWDDPQETARRIVDGWLDTGDLVQVDPRDGQFRILGRVDDRITLTNARKLQPAPIEQRVLGLSGVLHALLVPAGRHVELWIDVTAEQRGRRDWEVRIQRLLADLPSWQRPRRVRVLPQALAEISGALTRKGTPVRAKVIAAFARGQPASASVSNAPGQDFAG